MNKTINMIVAGPRGKMGQEAFALLNERSLSFSRLYRPEE